MFFDPLYLLIMIIGIALSGLTSLFVRVAFKRGSKVSLRSGLTGAEAAAKVVQYSGLEGVKIIRHKGFLSDHYNPLTKTLALSPDVYDGRNASAAGVAAHEAGHAIQHAKGYFPLWLRTLLVPVAKIGSSMGVWLIVISLILNAVMGYTNRGSSSIVLQQGSISWIIAVAGVLLFAAAVLFSIITVPVEFNASHRAKILLSEIGIVQSDEERSAVSGVLTAAGLTYVAAALTAVLQLLYWLSRLGFLRRN